MFDEENFAEPSLADDLKDVEFVHQMDLVAIKKTKLNSKREIELDKHFPTFSNSNSRILCMCRLDRLEPEDSLLEDDDEWLWLDDAIAIVFIQDFSSLFPSHFVNIALNFLCKSPFTKDFSLFISCIQSYSTAIWSTAAFYVFFNLEMDREEVVWK